MEILETALSEAFFIKLLGEERQVFLIFVFLDSEGVRSGPGRVRRNRRWHFRAHLASIGSSAWGSLAPHPLRRSRSPSSSRPRSVPAGRCQGHYDAGFQELRARTSLFAQPAQSAARAVQAAGRQEAATAA